MFKIEVTIEEFQDEIESILEKLKNKTPAKRRAILSFIIANLLVRSKLQFEEVLGILELAKLISRLSYRLYVEDQGVKDYYV